METFGEKLKSARTRKGMKQSEVAAILDCAATSLTNWENGKVQPSMDVVARLCEIYEIKPSSLLSKVYTYNEIADITKKPAYDRAYEEEIALTFSYDILKKLLTEEAHRSEAERISNEAAFTEEVNLIARFGALWEDGVKKLRAEYEQFGEADSDILFAYHALTPGVKAVFLDMLRGLITAPENIQPITANMDKATAYTAERLVQQSRDLRQGGVDNGTRS